MRAGGRCQAPVDSECLLTSTLDSFQNERSLPLRGAPEILSQHASAAYKRVVSVRVAKAGIVARSPLLASRRCLETPGIESPQEKGDSPMLSASSDRDLDQLGDEITELSAHPDAATARLLDLVSEFDGRGGWSNGFRSCAAWLSWRVGFAPGAAREHVRVAHALGSLPLLSQAFARGELSYSKVRELTASPRPRPKSGCSRWAAPAPPSTSSASCAAGAGWTPRPRRRRPPASTPAGHSMDPYDSPGSPVGVAPPGQRVSLPGLRRTRRAGAPHPSLGPGRAHEALEPRASVSPAPPRGPRGGLSGRAPAGWLACVQVAR